MSKVRFLFLIFLMTACSTPNHVTKIEQTGSVVKYQKNSQEKSRFGNLYPGKKTYPKTCEQDCYQAIAEVVCETTAENCRYRGKQQKPALDTGFSLRWLGHASFYLQSPSGTKLLLDPVSEQFDWPVDWAFRLSAGFFRNEPKWLLEDEIKSIDGVLYSHIHYDHFNKSDIADIGNAAQYYVPLGFAEHFPTGGYKINEMTWFSKTQLNHLSIDFVPAHHFSSRIWVPYIYEDNDMTLWGGWLFEEQGKKVFFAGDTGYSKHFSDIQQRYGDIDVCLIPIASYFHKNDGDWYRYVHTTPEDALIAAQELNCKVMIPWGYGNSSWKMGDRSSHSPLLRLLNMHKQMNSPIKLHILNEGEEIAL